MLVVDHNEHLFQRAAQSLTGVFVLANTADPGLSGARNCGVKAATGDVIAFLDDDATADPSWLGRLLEPYQEDGDVVGVGGRVIPTWSEPRPHWLPEEFLWVVGCSYTGQPRGRADVRNAIGANMSFLRAAFTAVGGFDGTVGRIGKDAAGCEETEFSIRVRRTFPTARVVLEPSAVCHHLVTRERTTRRYFRDRCRAEGRSKAVVAGLAGQQAALKSEREYVRRTLPIGVWHGLRDAAAGDLAGLARAGTILEGLLLTAAAYAWTRRHIPR